MLQKDFENGAKNQAVYYYERLKYDVETTGLEQDVVVVQDGNVEWDHGAQCAWGAFKFLRGRDNTREVRAVPSMHRVPK